MLDDSASEPPPTWATTAFGINERGEVVGSYTDSSNKTHGFVRIGELFRSVDFPGAAYTQARGISPAGEIVGSYRLPGEPSVNFHGYLLTRGGEFRRVDFPGHINTIPQRIGPDGTSYGAFTTRTRWVPCTDSSIRATSSRSSPRRQACTTGRPQWENHRRPLYRHEHRPRPRIPDQRRRLRSL